MLQVHVLCQMLRCWCGKHVCIHKQNVNGTHPFESKWITWPTWTFKLALKTMVETLYRSRGRQSTAPVLLFYSLKTHQMSASFLETHLCIHPIHALEEMLLSPSPTGKHLFHRCSLETPLQIACCPKWHPHLEHRNSTFSGVVFSSSWISRDGSDIQDWCCLQSSKH